MSMLDKLYIEHRQLRPGSLNAYLFAFAAIACAICLWAAAGRLVPRMEFYTLFPAVVLTTLICGNRAGFFAIALGFWGAWYLILAPRFSFFGDDKARLYTLASFAVISTTNVMLIGAMRSAIGRLRLMNQTLNTAFEANPDAILLTNEDGRVVNVNQRSTELFRLPRAALIGLPIEDLVPERLRSDHAIRRRNFSADPHLRSMGAIPDLFARRGDGTEFPVDVQIAPTQIGKSTLVISTVRDLTDQIALTEALAESQRQKAILEERERAAKELRLWADAFQCAAVGIEISDPLTETILMVNPAYAQTHGLTIEQAQGRRVIDTYAPEERPRLAALFAESDRTGDVSYESVHLRQDGSMFPVQQDITSVRGSDGQLLYRVGSSRDITESKRTEEALRHSQKMEALGTVTGGMAHDFNNMLQIIIGNLDLVDVMPRHSIESKELIEEALSAALKGAELTRSLLAFARRQALHPVQVDLNELVTTMHRLLSRVLGETIRISLDLANDLWPVTADPGQIEASIVNLATNARDAMPRGGMLTISTGNRYLDADYAALYPEVKPGEYAMISVSDNGVGMTREVVAKIFEPFFTTKPEGQGTGLGLSMVFGFASQSAGHVAACSEPGYGTTMQLFLPRTERYDQPARPESSGTPIAGRGETVLVVEDNAAIRRVVVRQIRDLGYLTIEADGPAAALDILARETVALLFSDVLMPGGMDGYTLASEVRARWPQTKVVMTSGFSGKPAELSVGSKDLSLPILTKPYRQNDLARTLRNILDH